MNVVLNSVEGKVKLLQNAKTNVIARLKQEGLVKVFIHQKLMAIYKSQDTK